MLVQIENLPDYNAADEVVQEDQAALERDEREEEHEGGNNEEMLIFAWNVMQTLPATFEREKPWEMRVQDS